MIKQLILTCFKRHESLVVNFQGGLVVLRGANEAGKSSLYHAIVYAFFGARALPMSLAETVTWGRPESALKVGLTFAVSGQDYSISRSKSGAELLGPSGLRVSGHAEVTRYVEQLLGVTASIAERLMVASQSALQGSLEDGSAVSLIEKLSDLGLLDELVEKIKDSLPSGSTKLLDEQLRQLRLVAPPVADFTDHEKAVELAVEAARLTDQQVARLIAAVQVAEGAAAEAQTALQAVAAYDSEVRAMQRNKEVAESRLAREAVVVEDTTAVLEEKIQAQMKHAPLAAAWKVWELYKAPTVFGDADWMTQLTHCKSVITATTAQLAVLDGDIRVQQTLRITETACGLCGKDLTDVPEVAAKNDKVEAEIQRLQAERTSLQMTLSQRKQQRDELAALQREVENADAYIRDLAVAAEQGLLEIADTVPPVIKWVGDPPVVDATDYRKELAAVRASLQRAAVDAAQRATAERELEAATAALAGLGERPDAEGAQAALEALAAARKSLQDAQGLARLETQTKAKAEQDLAVARAEHERDLAAYAETQEQVAAFETSIAAYGKNNELIKRLREVRPLIAAQLWAVVLSAVSRSFTAVRGEDSVVTLAGAEFQVNQRPAKALSGSTLDSLGLAIRTSLSRTFLPSVGFLLLDEPASGMDVERETAMLGQLVSLNYQQVIVITHSSLADSFATQVVQI